MVNVPQVTIPDFAGSIARGQQVEQSRLQGLLARQAMDESQRFNSALPGLAGALTTGEGPQYESALAQLLAAGPRGAQMAIPLVQAQRQRREAAAFDWGGAGGGATPTVARQTVAAQAPGQVPPDVLAHIEEASRETGIPVPILVAQYRQESGWDNSRRGQAGEIGIAQVLPATARNPGFGVAGVDPATLTDPRANILFGARYLRGRGQAAGVTDWNDPAQVDRALAAYNGGGDPNYVQNVRRWIAGAPANPDATPAAGPVQGGAPAAGTPPTTAGGPPRMAPGEAAALERALASDNPMIQQRARARIQMLQLQQQNNPEQYVAATEMIDGRAVQGQRNTRTGQFTEYRRPGAAEGLSAGQARATVARLGPRVASGQLTPDMPEYNDYAMAHAVATQPQRVWVDDPNNPGMQRMVDQPGINLDPARFPPPAVGAGQAGGVVPTQAGAPSADPSNAALAPSAPPSGVQIGATGLSADPPADATAVNPSGLSRQAPNTTPTGEENLAAGYARRMVEAEGLLAQAVGRGYVPGNLRDAAATAVAGGRDAGFARRAAGNAAMSTEGQLYRQAQEDWVRAKLRRESGAVIGEDEMAREIQVYFPQPGDSDAVIAQKAEARRVAISAMRQGAGRAGTSVPGQASAPEPAQRRRAEEAVARARRELGAGATDDAIVERARGYMQ